MVKYIIRFILSIFKRKPTGISLPTTLVQYDSSQSNSDIDIVAPHKLDNVPVQKELSWFSRANNLLEEFHDEPIFYSSDFSIHTETREYMQEYKGYVLMSDIWEHITAMMCKIDLSNIHIDGDIIFEDIVIDSNDRIYTKERYDSQFISPKDIVVEVDDFDQLKDDPNYAKPNLPQSKNIKYITGFDPHKKNDIVNGVINIYKKYEDGEI